VAKKCASNEKYCHLEESLGQLKLRMAVKIEPIQGANNTRTKTGLTLTYTNGFGN